MFWGEHSIRLDEKGRLFLPAKFRSQTEEGVVVLPDARECLTVLPLAVFEGRIEELLKAPITAQRTQDFTRRMGSQMTVDTPDKQNRITLTPALLAHAGIDRDALIIGALSRAEIWAPDKWAAEQVRISALAAEHDEGEGIAMF